MKNRNLKVDDNWKTPEWFYDQLNAEFGFDFDPCPYNDGEINDSNDGLLMEWGSVNFVNPPYSRSNKEAFVLKAIEESRKGKICVMLLPVSTSTKLFHDHIQPFASEIRFVRGRIKFEKFDHITGLFYTPKNGGMHDSMIVVFDGINN